MKIKCPFCNGVENRMWFSHLDTKPLETYAVFVVECWSGDLNKTSKHHFFQTRIRLLRKTEIDQLEELQKEIDELQEGLPESEAKTIEAEVIEPEGQLEEEKEEEQIE